VELSQKLIAESVKQLENNSEDQDLEEETLDEPSQDAVDLLGQL
jgi:hypothetical protein